jgi:hypothetical protein
MSAEEFDPINVYAYIRAVRRLNPVDVYNSQVDMPLILSGPDVATIITGNTQAERILEIEELVAAHILQDEIDMDSAFVLSATIQFDRHTHAPRAFCFGHLRWMVRIVIPTPYPSFCQPELTTFLADLGPFLGVDLDAKIAKFNSLLFSQTGRALPILGAPPADDRLKAAFLEVLGQTPPGPEAHPQLGWTSIQ